MRIPYGFTLTNNGTLEINRSDADNVALVFDLYMAGASLGKVADMLFSKQIPSPTGKAKWTRAAVDHLLSNGKYVAIIGHSGSGKSTLMNMLGCLDTPTSGDYYLDGVNVAGMTGDETSGIRNKQIGFIFQSFNLIKNLNALENVELPLIYRGLPAGKRRLLALEALERVGLASRMDHRPNQMSGGQQQRVAVARAIAAHPPLILADEPTGNLDTRAGARVFEIIRALHAEGNTIVLITHDEGLARKAQRIVRITDGKIDDGEREVF